MKETLNIEVTELDSGSFRAEIPETFLFWIDKDEAEAVRIVTEMYKHVQAKIKNKKKVVTVEL